MTSLARAQPTVSVDPVRSRRLGTGLLVVAAAYLVAAAMMGLVFASGPPARLVEGLAEYAQGETLYRWGFVGASLLAPTFTTMLLLLAAAVDVPTSSTRRSIATVLLAAYVTCATVAYGSQYLVLPRLVARDPEVAAAWYFHDVDSIPYAIDLAGYALLSLAAVLLASLFVERAHRALAGWLVAMAALSIAAFGLHAAGADAAAGLSSLASAVFTVPVAVHAVIEGQQRRRRTPT